MNMYQFLNIIWARKWLALFTLFTTVITTVVVSLLLPKQYEATAALVVDQRSVDPVTKLSLESQLFASYMATQVDILSSHNVALKVVDLLNLVDNPFLRSKLDEEKNSGDIHDQMADFLLKEIEVRPSVESSVIQLNFSAPDPNLAADVANAFTTAYIKTNVELRAQPAKLNADWFDEQTNYFRERLRNAQQKLSAYQQQHGIVIVDEKLDIENSRLVDLSHQLVDSQSRTYELLSRKNQLEGGRLKGLSYDSMAEVLNNPLIQNLKADLARAEAKFSEKSQGINVNHPDYQQIHAEVTSLRNKLNKEINTVIHGIRSSSASAQLRDQSLLKALAEQKAKVLELKQQRDQIAVLNREVESAQRFYDNAMERSVQTRLESEVNQSNVAILTHAIPPIKSAKPKVVLNTVLAMFLGGMLGLGLALLAEILDRKVHSSQDVADLLELPVLGVLVAGQTGKFNSFYINKYPPTGRLGYTRRIT